MQSLRIRRKFPAIANNDTCRFRLGTNVHLLKWLRSSLTTPTTSKPPCQKHPEALYTPSYCRLCSISRIHRSGLYVLSVPSYRLLTYPYNRNPQQPKEKPAQ